MEKIKFTTSLNVVNVKENGINYFFSIRGEQMSNICPCCNHEKGKHDDYGCKVIHYGIDVKCCKCNYKWKKYRDSFIQPGVSK